MQFPFPCIHHLQNAYELFWLPRIRPLRSDYFKIHCQKTFFMKFSQIRFCFAGHILYCFFAENDPDLVHLNYSCLLVKETDRVASLHNIFCRFLDFLPDVYQRNGDSRLCACYKVYDVDTLTDNWNIYKEPIRPKLTPYLPSVEDMVACIFWWLAKIFMSIVFV